jgi:uncharacterized RDD family membrane protein YckC
MNEDQILDEPLDEEENRKYVIRNLASGGKRFAHLLIDTIGYYIFIFLFAMVVAIFDPEINLEGGFFTILYYLLYVFYFWIFETLTGKTLGKLITRTRIVKEDGSKPDTLNILGRSFSRLIPFDAFSFLGTAGKGWHDSIPKIYVINDK